MFIEEDDYQFLKQRAKQEENQPDCEDDDSDKLEEDE